MNSRESKNWLRNYRKQIDVNALPHIDCQSANHGLTIDEQIEIRKLNEDRKRAGVSMAGFNQLKSMSHNLI